MMPGMTGPQLARQICATHPEVKVVLISGFSESPTYLEQGWEFLQKPFPPNILCAKLHEICDNAG
jgi:YesN/AraC family two-component response regulator